MNCMTLAEMVSRSFACLITNDDIVGCIIVFNYHNYWREIYQFPVTILLGIIVIHENNILITLWEELKKEPCGVTQSRMFPFFFYQMSEHPDVLYNWCFEYFF